jgi:drug/metabolite transporter (DMT)-like permease
MSWYIFSILAALSFTGMVLCTRYLGNRGFSSEQILLFILGFAFFGFFIVNVGTLNTIWESENFLSFVFMMAVVSVFIVIINWTGFTAVIKAPNPGFPGAIKGGSALLTTLISVLIFGSSLNLVELLGILLIISGIALLIIEKKNIPVLKQGREGFLRWDVLSIINALSLTVVVLGIKQVSQMGFSSQQIALVYFGFNFLAFALLTRKEFRSYFQDKNRLKDFLPVVFLAAIFSFVANIFNIKGIAIAPNPGYHEAIKNTQVLFITLLSVPLLGASLTKWKLLGVVLALAGAIILVI